MARMDALDSRTLAKLMQGKAATTAMIEIFDSDNRVPIRAWLSTTEIEPGALDQLRNAANHPDVGPAVAVMPDCHVGFGVTIGCVFPTVGTVIPNAVGVDIGCGMCAVNTGVRLNPQQMDRQFWRSWMSLVQRAVPTGFASFKRPQDLGELDRPLRATSLQPLIRDKARYQIGTLGGGNHFLEAQVDQHAWIWLMVHSGSRHTGLRIADYYNRAAIALAKDRAPVMRQDLASLRLDEQIGGDYLSDMEWATDFALESRLRMIHAMLAAISEQIERSKLATSVDPSDIINIHHNMARLETHEGSVLTIHRKGATSAEAGQIGIIPGSMGSSSFIVRGKGNPLSFNSCSHGAGRTMSRKSAMRSISEESFGEALRGTYSVPSMSYADEAPQAYKDIDTVIQRQTDLIEVVDVLRPIITIKGESRAKDD